MLSHPKYAGGVTDYLPITVFNKKAQVFVALVHKGSKIYAKGTIMTKLDTTDYGKTIIAISFKVTDFDVIQRTEPSNIEESDFVDVVELYDPESFMDSEEGE